MSPSTTETGQNQPLWRSLGLVLVLAVTGLLLRYAAFVVLTHGTAVDAYLSAMCTRDCGWYAQIAVNGYDLHVRPDGTANWAFFPLTPMLLAAIHRMTGLSLELCGTIMGELAIVSACLIARALFDREVSYRLFCVLALLGPFAYAYGLGMSEPLFFLLSVAVFVGLKQRRLALVAVAAALLAATRVTGILILAAIVLDWLSARRSPPAPQPNAIGYITAMAIAPLGLLAYMAYLQIHVGDALAFAHVQSAWGRGLSNPVANIVDGLLLKHHAGYGLTMSIFSLIGLGAAAVLAWRRQVGMAAFVALSLILALSTGILSIVRFVAGLFPVTFVAAETLAPGRRSFAVASIVATIVGVLFALMWIGGSPLLT